MPSGSPAPTFDLSGGRACLDFANTLSKRLASRPRERLVGYGDLVAWSRQAGVVTEREAGALLREAQRRPAEAAAVLERAIHLREAIYRIFSAAAGERPAGGGDLATLNAALADALPLLGLVPAGDRFAWEWTTNGQRLDRMLWPVARSAADLLTAGELARVRECEAETCAWLFMDRSRNRSRRWCDMKACGNRAKARRHYERKKGGQAR
jgi:predicted RNA-binding Zn ribbon-like protein